MMSDEGRGEPSSPRVLDRDGVLSVLGYRGEVKQFQPVRYLPEDRNLCYKCDKKVYPVERIDVGELYHRSCFRCRVCNTHLTLRNFQRGLDVHTNSKEVFCNQHVPKHHAALQDKDALEIKSALAAQKAANKKGEHVGVGQYGQGALEFQHLKREKAGRRVEDRNSKKVRRSSTLRSFQDFERYGIFEAQVALEKVQKQEEDELYKQMAEDRTDQMEGLHSFVDSEKQKTVQELVYWFQKRGTSREEISDGLKKVDYYYARQLEERIKLLERRLGAEEKAAVARMIEKHAHEMIALIAEKEKQAEGDMKRHQEKLRSQLDAHDVASARIQGNVKDKQEQLKSHLGEQIHDKLTHGEPGSRSRSSSQSQTPTPAPRANQEPVKPLIGVSYGEHAMRTSDEGHGHNQAHGHPDNQGYSQGQAQGYGQDHAPRTTESGGSLFNQVELVSSVAEGSLSKMAEVRDGHAHKNPSTGTSNQVEYFSDGKLVVAAGGADGTFKPITPVITEVRMAPDVVRLKDTHFLPQHVRVEVESEHNRSGYMSSDYSNSAFEDYSRSEDEFEEDDVGTEASYTLDDIEQSLAATDLNTRWRDASGHPFMQLQQPPGPGTRGTPHPNAQGMTEPTTEDTWRGTPHPAKSQVDPATSEPTQPPPKSKKDKKDKKKKKTYDDDEEESAARRRRRERREQKKQYLEEITRPLEVDEEAMQRDNEINENILNAEVAQPKVVPPRETKSKLYTDPSIFQEFDDHALQEAKKDHKSYTHLVRELSVNCKNELQKVRAIFIWITAKDLNSISFEDEVDPDSPMGLLRGIKHGAESYHNLFKRLCSYAGMHCEIVEGYSKGSGYKPGTQLRGDMFRNQWTAVWVKRSWRFINCNWGARHVKGPREERMTYKVDEFYFLTDPHEHIYQHYPLDQKWQLLREPITIDEFARLPVVKSPFFNNHLAFAKDYGSVINVKEGMYEIKLICPPKLYNFAGKLISKDKSSTPEVLQEKMLVRMIENDVVFLVNLPVPGKYYLDLYVATSHANQSMDHACGFVLNCLGPSKHPNTCYPQVGPFGRLPYFQHLGLTEETHPDSYITAHGDFVVAVTGSKPVRVTHTLHYYNQREKTNTDCERYAFPKHRGDSLVSFVVKCPKKGLYVLTLTAESTGSDRTPHAVYRYLIDCRTPVQAVHSFPRASKRWQHCKLHSPVSGDLPVNSKVMFKIESQLAKGMVVVIDDQWKYLERDGDMWVGEIFTGLLPDKAMVYGRIDANRDKYIPCLEYAIVDLRFS